MVYLGRRSDVQDADFFQALHVSHLKDKCPEILKYLGLAPGWRVLVASEYEDVWYDEKLLDVGKRLAKYVYPGPAVVVMMLSPSIDISRAHHESEPKQKRSQPPALV